MGLLFNYINLICYPLVNDKILNLKNYINEILITIDTYTFTHPNPFLP